MKNLTILITLILLLNIKSYSQDTTNYIYTFKENRKIIHVTTKKNDSKIKSIEFDFNKVPKKYKSVKITLLLEMKEKDLPSPEKLGDTISTLTIDDKIHYLVIKEKFVLFSENKIIKFNNLDYLNKEFDYEIRYTENDYTSGQKIILK